MSLRLLTLAWKTDCKSPTAKLVLVALADYANDSGLCWPSNESLRSKCNLSATGIRTGIHLLESMNLMTVDRSRGRRSNRFHLILNPTPGEPFATPTVRVANGKPYATRASTLRDANPNRKEPPIEPPGGGIAPRLSTTERIGLEKSLERTHERLKELKDADFPRGIEERKMLKVEKADLLFRLGLKV